MKEELKAIICVVSVMLVAILVIFIYQYIMKLLRPKYPTVRGGNKKLEELFETVSDDSLYGWFKQRMGKLITSSNLPYEVNTTDILFYQEKYPDSSDDIETVRQIANKLDSVNVRPKNFITNMSGYRWLIHDSGAHCLLHHDMYAEVGLTENNIDHIWDDWTCFSDRYTIGEYKTTYSLGTMEDLERYQQQYGDKYFQYFIRDVWTETTKLLKNGSTVSIQFQEYDCYDDVTKQHLNNLGYQLSILSEGKALELHKQYKGDGTGTKPVNVDCLQAFHKAAVKYPTPERPYIKDILVLTLYNEDKPKAVYKDGFVLTLADRGRLPSSGRFSGKEFKVFVDALEIDISYDNNQVRCNNDFEYGDCFDMIHSYIHVGAPIVRLRDTGYNIIHSNNNDTGGRFTLYSTDDINTTYNNLLNNNFSNIQPIYKDTVINTPIIKIETKIKLLKNYNYHINLLLKQIRLINKSLDEAKKNMNLQSDMKLRCRRCHKLRITIESLKDELNTTFGYKTDEELRAVDDETIKNQIYEVLPDIILADKDYNMVDRNNPIAFYDVFEGKLTLEDDEDEEDEPDRIFGYYLRRLPKKFNVDKFIERANEWWEREIMDGIMSVGYGELERIANKARADAEVFLEELKTEKDKADAEVNNKIKELYDTLKAIGPKEFYYKYLVKN